MVPILTHLATVQTCSQRPDVNGIMQNPQLGPASEVPISAFYQPKTPGQIYTTFMVDLKQGGIIQCNLGDEAQFPPSSVVTLVPINGGGPTIYCWVTGHTRRLDAGGVAIAADHSDVLVQIFQFAPKKAILITEYPG